MNRALCRRCRDCVLIVLSVMGLASHALDWHRYRDSETRRMNCEAVAFWSLGHSPRTDRTVSM